MFTTGTLTERRAGRQDCSESFLATIGPVPQGVGAFLRQVTPAASAAGRIYTRGRVCPLPLTGLIVAPLGLSDFTLGSPLRSRFRTYYGRAPQADVLADAIAAALPSPPGCRPRGQVKRTEQEHALLRRLLGDDALRADGRPMFLPRDAYDQSLTKPTREILARQRVGARGRDILAAVLADIEGHSLGLDEPESMLERERLAARNKALGLSAPDPQDPIDFSVSRWIGLKDHLGVSPDRVYAAEPEKARKKRSAGRRLLSAIGFWPWTHVERGRLPRDWRSMDDFIAPLADWLSAARAETSEGQQAWPSVAAE
jgi:hypothetical protein